MWHCVSLRCLWIGNGGGREDLRFVQDGGFDGACARFCGNHSIFLRLNVYSLIFFAGPTRYLSDIFEISVSWGLHVASRYTYFAAEGFTPGVLDTLLRLSLLTTVLVLYLFAG